MPEAGVRPTAFSTNTNHFFIFMSPYYYYQEFVIELKWLTLLTPELNPSAQHCLPRFFTGDF
jgi:hypothetical protein